MSPTPDPLQAVDEEATQRKQEAEDTKAKEKGEEPKKVRQGGEKDWRWAAGEAVWAHAHAGAQQQPSCALHVHGGGRQLLPPPGPHLLRSAPSEGTLSFVLLSTQSMQAMRVVGDLLAAAACTPLLPRLSP
jgi:hypothetical protein